MLDINLDTFERKMHLVNGLLFEKKLFLPLNEKKTQNLDTCLKKDTKKMRFIKKSAHVFYKDSMVLK